MNETRINEKINNSLLPSMIIFSSVIILFVFKITYTSYYYSNNYFSEVHTDSFLTIKRYAIITLSIISVLLFLFKIIKGHKILFNIIYIPMLVYLLCVVMSTINSIKPSSYDLSWVFTYEGTAITFCYIFIIFLFMNALENERQLRIIIIFFLATMFILSMIGILHLLGYDVLLLIKIIDFKPSGNIQTIGNINYVGFYLSLVIPIIGMLFLYSKKVLLRAVLLVLFALSLVNLFSATSLSSYIGLSISFVIAVLLLGKELKIKIKSILVILITSVIVFILMFHSIENEIKSFTNISHSGDKQIATDKVFIDYIITDENKLKFSIEGIEIIITATTDDFVMMNNYRNTTESILEEMIVDKNLPTVTIKPNNESNVLILETDGYEWEFLYKDNNILYRNSHNILVKLEKVKTIDIISPSFGSGRGYIWARILPMIKDTIVIGKGPSTIILSFPQDDYVGKYNMGLKEDFIVHNSHNMYLGAAINTGAISLIAFVFIIIIYYIQSIKTIKSMKDRNLLFALSAGILSGISGYLTVGLMNESSLTVASLFYSLLGIGMAINLIYRRKSF